MRISFRAESLRKQTNMTVLLPDQTDAPGPFPVLYLLHGMQGDDTMWTNATRIQHYVNTLPLIVVMPDGGRSWYTDARHGLPYETHIIRDVIGFVDRGFNTIPERRARAIGGWSMGAFGAVKLALKHPRLFSSLVASSGVYDFTNLFKRPDLTDECTLIFGDDPDLGPDNNVFQLAESVNRTLLPAIRLECGTEDTLLSDARRLHTHLQKLNIPHEYAELPGIHSLSTWDPNVPAAIAFHKKALGL